MGIGRTWRRFVARLPWGDRLRAASRWRSGRHGSVADLGAILDKIRANAMLVTGCHDVDLDARRKAREAAEQERLAWWC